MDDLDRIRAEHAARFIERGSGIEIGAFGRPVQLPKGVKVQYVDKYPADVVLKHHGFPPDTPILQPDVLDDGTTLRTFQDGTLDFIIACHFLEHCENLIGTLRVHMRKVRPDGLLFYILPDKDRMFDKVRPSTPFDHILRDAKDGGKSTREEHIAEWCRFMPHDEAAVRREPEQIHFHCWNAQEQRQLLLDLEDYLPPFRIQRFHSLADWPEVIIVLRVL